MLIQHSGILAGGHREGIDSQYREREKKKTLELNRTELRGEAKTGKRYGVILFISLSVSYGLPDVYLVMMCFK